MTEFYSLTGERVDLKKTSDEQLAEVLDGLEAELSLVRERLSLVTRELASRMLPAATRRAGEWDIKLRHTATAKRVHVD